MTDQATLFSDSTGPPSMLILVAALIVLSIAAIYVFSQQKQGQQQESQPSSPRALKRRMSRIGLTTLVTEIDTNLSIPVSVMEIEGQVTKDELAERLQTRILTDDFFLRFRSLVKRENSPWTFEEVPNFNIQKNVFSHLLKKGETTMSYVESLVNTPLDFAKPLWEMHVIEDPARTSQKTHVAWKIHHCIGDGASLSMAMIKLSDNRDQFDAMVQQMQEAQKQKSPSAKKALKQRFQDIIGLCALWLWSTYVIVRKLLALTFRSEPATIFKLKGGQRKTLSYNMLYSVATTKAIGKKHHATVNDVMLSCVAGAMRKTMLAAGEQVAPGLIVRAAIPVDMRSTSEVIRSLRNKFSSLVIDFPVGVENPEKRLRMIKTSMNEAKLSLEKFFTYATSHVVAQLPTFLTRMIVHFTTSRISVAISNVRASSFDISMCGKALLGFYGFVPPPPTVNLGIAILSVGDDLGLNVLVDPNVGIDAKQFLDFAKDEFDALKQQALSDDDSAPTLLEQKKNL